MSLPRERWQIGTRWLHYICGNTALWTEADWLNTALAHAPRNPDHVYVDLAPRDGFGCFHPNNGARKVSHAVRTLRKIRKENV